MRVCGGCQRTRAMDINTAAEEDLSSRAHVVLPRRPRSEEGEAQCRLWLGDRVAAANAARLGVEAVVNCAPRHVAAPEPAPARYLELDLSDAPVVSRESGEVSFDDAAQHFEGACAFINEAMDAGLSVLVHCAGGVSRSATVVLAYLIAREGMSLRDAYEYLSSVRAVIGPNATFFTQLVELEERVHGKASMQRPLSVHQRVYKAVVEEAE